MKRLVIFVLAVIMAACANSVAAEKYHWIEVFNFPAKRIVTVPSGYNDYDHRVYSFTDRNGQSSLLFVCHGTVNSQGEYTACMGGKYYTDYASAVDNEIRYHINRGEIRGNSFDNVYFLTCYSGYASQQNVTLPVLQKNLKMVLYERNVEGLCEIFDNNWRVARVSLLIDRPPLPGIYGGKSSDYEYFKAPKNSVIITAEDAE